MKFYLPRQKRLFDAKVNVIREISGCVEIKTLYTTSKQMEKPDPEKYRDKRYVDLFHWDKYAKACEKYIEYLETKIKQNDTNISRNSNCNP